VLFLSLLTQYLENYGTEFHQTISIDAFWNKDECFSVWGQRVNNQGHVTSWPTAQWTRHTELSAVHRVVISSLNFVHIPNVKEQTSVSWVAFSSRVLSVTKVIQFTTFGTCGWKNVSFWNWLLPFVTSATACVQFTSIVIKLCLHCLLVCCFTWS